MDPTYGRYGRALAGRALPAALVDLDAFETNVDRLLAPARAAGKKVRLASKSIRCPALIRLVMARGGDTVNGLMTYTAAESAWLAEEGVARDLLLAYPTVQPSDLAALVEANRRARCAVVVDDPAQVEALSRAAKTANVVVPAIVEIDLSYRPLGRVLHLGVRRSPLRTAAEVVALARVVAAAPSLVFAGIMGYEAQIAGLTDASPFSSWQNAPRRALKKLSRTAVEETRAEVVRALAAAGLPATLVNGGGTGSVGWSSAEEALTEVTVGSGFLDAHLFDYYEDLDLEAAAFFALQVVRRPAPGLVTCHGGGYIASGDGGRDRLPIPALPAGCELLSMEGAGEVQTPVALPAGVEVALGEPIFFRHAKAGELAEHFSEYLLVRGDRVVDTAPTYRGLGRCFLG